MQSTLVIFALMSTSLSLQAVAQDVLSREDALQADLVEAVEMLEGRHFEMLIYDFMPAEMSQDLRRRSSLQYGRNDIGNVSQFAFPEAMQNQLAGQLKAAQTGKITWNRDKSLAWIQFTTKPIEVVPAQKPGYVPQSFGTAGSVSGLGPDIDTVLKTAIRLLEEERFDEFARGILPLEQVVELKSQQAMDRWVHRLKQHPSMVDAMIRDLKSAQSGAAVASLKMKKVAESWRLPGMDSSQQAEYQKLANSEIAASIIPAQKGCVVLAFTEGRWRLMAMPTRIPSAQDLPSRR